MGDIADMMIDGTCCECCGEYMGSEGEGYARYCSEQCAANRGVSYGRLDTGEDDDGDEEWPTVNTIIEDLDGAITWLEIAIDRVKQLKIKGRVKELKWLINRIDLFKQKLLE